MTFRPCACGSYPLAHRHAGGRVTTEHECRILAHERTWDSEAAAVEGWNAGFAAPVLPRSGPHTATSAKTTVLPLQSGEGISKTI